jgi:PadR family transcriptional regulator
MPADRPTPETFLPLKPVELLVLTMLTGGERHGYGIRQDIVEHTGGALVLEAGNLYRSIRKLETDGLIEESGRRPAADADDERRRYYRLAPFGKRVLAAEMLRLRALVRIAEERRIIAPVPA